MSRQWKLGLSGAAGGLVNGLFGGGGGMVLVPALQRCGVEERHCFACCVAVILPLCVLSAAVYALSGAIDLKLAAPYLLGGLAGGLLGGKLFKNVPVLWLRRIFAAFLLYGGVRYLL